MSKSHRTFMVAVEITQNSSSTRHAGSDASAVNSTPGYSSTSTKRAIVDADDMAEDETYTGRRRTKRKGPPGRESPDHVFKSESEAAGSHDDAESEFLSSRPTKSKRTSIARPSDNGLLLDEESDTGWAAYVSSNESWHSTDERASPIKTSRPSRRLKASPSPEPTMTFNGRLQGYAYAGATRSASKTNGLSLVDQPSTSSTPTSRARTRPSASSPQLHATPSRKKRSRPRPEVTPRDANSHLPGLTDTLTHNLLVLFVGVNPGIKSGAMGHPYAHPSNSFWKLLHQTGITPRRCLPSEHETLPALYRIGNTNMIARTTQSQANLERGEMEERVDLLEEKLATWKPEVVCLVGKGIWESVWKVKHGKAIKSRQFHYGFQHPSENLGRQYGDAWKGARVFVASSTSGLAATLSTEEKFRIWKELGDWVATRRDEAEVKGEEVGMVVEAGDDVV